MRLQEGLVFLSDTRTNAGVDDVGTYRKLHVFRPAPDRLFVLQSAGNLATTQEVLDRIAVDLAAPGERTSLASVPHLFEAALYVGGLGRDVSARHAAALGTNASATFILGGQIGDAAPDILLVYPEGNYVRASDDRPFLQIGESKYGKFLLDVAILAHTDLVTSTKIALGSMMSTARANLSVGPPYDSGVYRTGTFALDVHRFTADSPALDELREVWERNILRAVAELPDVEVAGLSDAPAASAG
jgi:putative proteasome-type protease